MKYLLATLLFIPTIASASTLSGLINSYRQQHNLPVAIVDNRACAFIDIRMKEVKNDWSHKGMLQLLGTGKYDGLWHENLARNFTNRQDVLNAWIKSPTHNANLLSDMKYMCVRNVGNYWIMEGVNPNW